MRKLFRIRLLRDPRLLLIVIPACVYANSLFGEFVYDDKELTVENNPALTGEASFWEILGWDRPLREFTYMFDHAIWGLNPLGFHLQNLFWHCANTLLFCILLQSLGVPSATAFWIALLFSLHPINTESVAWISGRKELLCLFFELCACLFLLSAYRNDCLISWTYGGCLVASIFALLSKQVAVVLPLLYAFSLWFYENQQSKSIHLQKIIRYLSIPCLVVLGFILFRYPVFEQLGFTREHGTFYDPAAREVSYTLLSALLTPFATFAKSIVLCIWPMDLTVEHAFLPVSSFFDLRWIVGGCLLCALSALALFWKKSYPAFLFGIIWFLAAWIPVSGAVPVSYLVADRYLYIPCLGFCIASVTALYPVLQRFETKIPRISLLAVLTVSIFFTIRTVARNFDWRDEISLWQSAVHSSPSNAKAHSGLASAYAEKGESEAAFQEWNQSLEIQSNQPHIWVNMGNEEQRCKNLQEAERCYRKALDLFPEYGAAHFNLALLLEQKNQIDDALRHFQLAAQHLYHRINAEQRKGLAHYHIARILYAKGEFLAASYQLAYAEKLTTTYAPIYVLKGMLNPNHPDLARQAFEEAIRLNPALSDAYFNLGVLEWQQGNHEKAESLWKKAVELKPSLNQQIDRVRQSN